MTWEQWEHPAQPAYFNSHPHEVDDEETIESYGILVFQLTSSRRGWHDDRIHVSEGFNFNSHPHEEDDHGLHTTHNTLTRISTHILTKRMTHGRICSACCLLYFNSHPHEEDDWLAVQSRFTQNISTHILTKRMTWQNQMWYRNPSFQLTSSRRGWLKPSDTWIRSSYFNSHPHEEDDGYASGYASGYTDFNSHPHEEDDSSMDGKQGVNRDFNSHPHEEDDRIQGRKGSCESISTHILTKRMTMAEKEEKKRARNFNSHPHEEDDFAPFRSFTSFNCISTHILTKRMTRGRSRRRVDISISTHILTKRMTDYGLGMKVYKNISTHILTKRMTKG